MFVNKIKERSNPILPGCVLWNRGDGVLIGAGQGPPGPSPTPPPSSGALAGHYAAAGAQPCLLWRTARRKGRQPKRHPRPRPGAGLAPGLRRRQDVPLDRRTTAARDMPNIPCIPLPAREATPTPHPLKPSQAKPAGSPLAKDAVSHVRNPGWRAVASARLSWGRATEYCQGVRCALYAQRTLCIAIASLLSWISLREFKTYSRCTTSQIRDLF